MVNLKKSIALVRYGSWFLLFLKLAIVIFLIIALLNISQSHAADPQSQANVVNAVAVAPPSNQINPSTKTDNANEILDRGINMNGVTVTKSVDVKNGEIIFNSGESSENVSGKPANKASNKVSTPEKKSTRPHGKGKIIGKQVLLDKSIFNSSLGDITLLEVLNFDRKISFVIPLSTYPHITK